MGRLVDIEDVKDFINGLDSLPWEEEVDDLVKTIPTAYDDEKVVAELEEKRIEYELYSENAPDVISKTYRKGVMRGYEYSKDIVRKGGVE